MWLVYKLIYADKSYFLHGELPSYTDS